MACLCKNVEKIQMFAKDFIQHRYYGFMFTFLFLHSLEEKTGSSPGNLEI